jgi:hypothetical protein
LLQFCPTVPEDKAARESFAKIGVEPGKPFDPNSLSPEMKKALETGMTQGQQEIADSLSITKTAAHLFGTRAVMWFLRRFLLVENVLGSSPL